MRKLSSFRSPVFAGLYIGLSLVFAFAGCSTRVLHPNLKPDPKILVRQWVRPTQPNPSVLKRGLDFSSPVLAGNTLLVATEGEGLVALYPSLNVRRWRFPVEPGGVISEVLVDGGKVYFGATDGNLYAVSLENGRMEWKVSLRAALYSRPTVVKGRLFVTTANDTVHAVDAGSGELIWTYRRKASLIATIHAASTPLVDGEEVLVGMSDGALVALNLQDGTLRWEKKLSASSKFIDVDARPVLADGVLYVPSYDGALHALRRRDGETLWRYDAGGSHEPVLEKDHIYLPSSNGQVYALDRRNGSVVWSFPLDGGGVPTRMLLIDGRLFFGSSYQFFYVLDASNGAPLYRWNAGRGSGFYGAPSYDETSRFLYALSSAGNLYSFLVRNPSQRTWARAPRMGYDMPGSGIELF